jgi:hypothetical protein
MPEINGRLDESLLSFERADHKPSNAVGLAPDERFFLSWKINYGLEEEAKAWLLENRKSFSDQTVKFRSFPDSYRSVGVTSQANSDREVVISQEFAKGWVQSLVLDDTIDYTEARLVEATHLPAPKTPAVAPSWVSDDDGWENPEDYHMIRWYGIDPEKAEAIVASINALTADAFSPVVNGESIGSDYTRLTCRWYREWAANDNDRAAIIDLLVAKPRFNLMMTDSYGTKAEARRYKLFNVPRYIAQDLINSYNAEYGASVNVGGENERGLLDIEITVPPELEDAVTVITARSCSKITTSSYYYSVTEPLATPADEGSGVWYDSSWSMNSTGKWTGVIEKNEEITQHVPEFVSDATFAEQGTTEIWNNARDDGNGGYVTEGGTPITLPDMSPEELKIKKISKRKNPTCTTDLSIEESTTIDQTGAAFQNTVGFEAETETHTQGEELAEEIASDGIVIEVQSEPTPYGRFRTARTVTTSIPKTMDAISVGRKFDSDERLRHGYNILPSDLTSWLNSAFATPLSEKEVGKKKSFSMQRNKDGSLDLLAIESDSSTLKDDLTLVIGSDCETIDTYIYFWNYTKEDLEAALAVYATISPGHSRRVSVGRNNEDGTFDATLVDSIANPSMPAVTLSYQVNAEIMEEREYRYLLTYTQFAAWVAGSTAWVEGTENSLDFTKVKDGCYYNVVRTVRTVIDQTSEYYEKSHSEQSVRLLHTHGDFIDDPGAPADGTTRRVEQRATRYGKFDTQDTTTTAIDQEGAEREESAARSVATLIHTQGDALSAPTPSVGTIIRQVERPTEFGKLSTQLETDVAKDQTASEFVASFAEQTTVETHTQGDVISGPPAPAVLQVRRISQEPTPYGKYRTSDSTTTIIDQTGVEREDSAARSVEVETHTQGDPIGAIASSVGTIVRSVERPTEYGKVASQNEVDTAKDQAGSVAYSSAAETRSTETHTHSTTAPATPSADITRIVVSPTPYGDNETLVEAINVIDQPTAEFVRGHLASSVSLTHTQGPELADPASAAEFTVVRGSQAPTEAGFYRTSLTTETAADVVSEEWDFNFAEKSTTINSTQGAEITSAPTVGIKQARKIVQRPTEHGRYQISNTTVDVEDLITEEGSFSHSETVERELHTQGPELTTPASAAAGEIELLDQQSTVYGAFHTVRTTKRARNQSGFNNEFRADQTTTVDTDTYSDSPPSSAIITPALGIIERKRTVPTDYGKPSVEVEKVEAHNQTTVSKSVSYEREVEETLNTYNDAPTLPTLVAGSKFEWDVAPTPFGYDKTIARVTTAKDLEGKSREDSSGRTVEVTEHTQATTALIPPAFAVGTISKQTWTQNEFGWFATRVETDTVTDTLIPFSKVDDNARRKIVEEVHTHALAALDAPTISVGFMKQVQNELTPYGTFKTTLQTTEVKPQSGDQAESDHHSGKIVTVETEADSPAALPATPVGTVAAVVNSPTESGKVDTVTTVETAKPITSVLSWMTPTGLEKRVYGINQPLGTCDTTVGGWASSPDYDVTLNGFQINKFGLEDYSFTVKGVPDTSVPSDGDVDSGMRTSEMTDYHYNANADQWYSRKVESTIWIKINADYITVWNAYIGNLGSLTGGAGTSPSISSHHFDVFTYSNGAKAYKAQVTWKKVSAWDEYYGTPPTTADIPYSGGLE